VRISVFLVDANRLPDANWVFDAGALLEADAELRP